MKLKISMIIVAFSIGLMLHAKEITKNYKIKGMMCEMNCPGFIKNEAEMVDGVKKCDVDFETGSATITFDNSKVDENKLASLLVKKTDNMYEIRIENAQSSKSWWDWLFGG